MVERTKKMATNIENALKRIKDSTQDFGKNIYEHVNIGLRSIANRNIVSEEDLRQYEQLVIMKKYPYLDLKELESKYSSSNKNTRQSIQFDRGGNLGSDPSISQLSDEGINVEITNRGLSGFAIPPQLSRRVGTLNGKAELVNEKLNNAKLTIKFPDKNVIGSLKNDIKEYVERKNCKLV